MTIRIRDRLWLAVVAAVLLAAAPFATLPAAAAPLDLVDEGEPGLLSIWAQPRELWAVLDPGEDAWWSLELRLQHDEPAAAAVLIVREGELATHQGGLRFGIRECSLPWQETSPPSCPGTLGTLLEEMPFSEVPPTELSLGNLDPATPRYLMARLLFPDPAPAELQGSSAEFGLRFSAAGDTETVTRGGTPSTPLASAGVALAAPLGVAALLTVFGTLLRVVARRRGAAT